MNAGTGCGWETGQVNDEIAYLPEEVVLIGVPIRCEMILVLAKLMG